MQVDEIGLVISVLALYIKLVHDIAKIRQKLERIEERTLWLEKYIRNSIHDK